MDLFECGRLLCGLKLLGLYALALLLQGPLLAVMCAAICAAVYVPYWTLRTLYRELRRVDTRQP